ncbi:MAG: hypothetical protein QOJ00_1980 [Actinomycetota bacterium]
MLVTRIALTDAGGTCFEDLDIELHEGGEIGRLSKPLPATSVIFRENDASYDYDWHNAPQRQFIVMLDGELEVEVTSGEKRRFRGGDILLVEDTTGTGHRSRNIGGPRRSLFIPVPEE